MQRLTHQTDQLQRETKVYSKFASVLKHQAVEDLSIARR
jgi:hypothetical protein